MIKGQKITADDVLSFADLTAQTIVEATELEGSDNLKEMSDRWIHTFLEYELYDRYIYSRGWTLEYVSASQGQAEPVVTTTKVDTLQEAEIIAVERFSRMLKKPVHLESMKLDDGENLYKIIDGTGIYRGMIRIGEMN